MLIKVLKANVDALFLTFKKQSHSRRNSEGSKKERCSLLYKILFGCKSK